MGLLHAFVQRDLGVSDTPTAGYNLLKMEISNKQYWRCSPWGPTEITTGLVGDNLLDVDVRNSVQFHKDEILLPGRSIKFFMNAKFGAEPPTDKAPAGYYKRATRSRPSRHRHRRRRPRSHSIPASPTTSCASASITNSIRTKSGAI
jgi:hypothetical protein